MRKLLILMLLGVLFAPMVGSAKADEVLYCQSELATAIAKVNGTWITGGAVKERLTIKFSNDYQSVTGVNGETHFKCRKGALVGEIICSTEPPIGPIFIYHTENKRFIYSRVTAGTFVNGILPADMMAGTCQKF